ncbi:hypothetical protein NQ176_g4848 [Zarea fungicola]|uniref:Uncharacterized protein n=1 Tax=Zarea fungicola TaxID=93591 RepID=A0ACC1NBC6_9HYPO|nr:hypothetical protein NQ176_g4848 [Lecanicillium fungicola]
MDFKALLAEADATLISISIGLETTKKSNAAFCEQLSLSDEEKRESASKESSLEKLSTDCAKKGDIEKACSYAAELQKTNEAAALVCHSFASSKAGNTTRAIEERLKAIDLFLKQGFAEKKLAIVTAANLTTILLGNLREFERSKTWAVVALECAAHVCHARHEQTIIAEFNLVKIGMKILNPKKIDPSSQPDAVQDLLSRASSALQKLSPKNNTAEALEKIIASLHQKESPHASPIESFRSRKQRRC